MNIVRIIIIAIALLVSGWLAFDGAKALLTGAYVTPKSGAHAGQLGPWSKIASAVGIDPRSTLMKLIHVVVGGAGLIALIAFLVGAKWGWAAMLVTAIAGLWYLPFGTLLGVIEIVLLILWRMKTESA